MINEMKMQEQLEEVLLIMAEKGLSPYKDGNQWCILLGENIQEGICGFGYTIIDAMMDFYGEATAEGIIRKEEQKSMKDKIIEDTISYLNGRMCFSNSVEELKYRSNLAYRLKSLRPPKDCSDCSKHLQGYIDGRSDAEKKLLDEYGILIMPEGELHMKARWKPSEDEERLINTSISFLKDFADKGYENAVECIDWLKSKLNGNTCK